MTLTVRLTPQLQDQLDSHCKARGISKTQVVVELLSEHLMPASSTHSKTAYELAREFGVVGGFASGGAGDLAQNRKQYLKEKLRAKRAR